MRRVGKPIDRKGERLDTLNLVLGSKHLLGSGIHLRQIEAVGKGQCFGIHRRAADDEHLLTLPAMREGFGQRGETFGTGKSRGGARQHDVAAIGQCALGQRLKRAPPHDDGMSRGELLETAQVGRKAEEQPVVVTDGAVARHGADDIDHEFLFYKDNIFLPTNLRILVPTNLF